MKLRFVFWIGLFCFLILGIILFTTIGLDFKKNNFNVQIENYLVSSVSAKEERLIDYLYELESDTMFLSNSEKSRAVFKEDIVINKDASIFDVSEEFLVIAKEIENYLKQKGVEYKVIDLPDTAVSVEDVVRLSGGQVKEEEIIKTLIVKTKTGDFVGRILQGKDRLKREVMDRLATKEEVLQIAGVEVGAVCPILLEADNSAYS